MDCMVILPSPYLPRIMKTNFQRLYPFFDLLSSPYFTEFVTIFRIELVTPANCREWKKDSIQRHCIIIEITESRFLKMWISCRYCFIPPTWVAYSWEVLGEWDQLNERYWHEKVETRQISFLLLAMNHFAIKNETLSFILGLAWWHQSRPPVLLDIVPELCQVPDVFGFGIGVWTSFFF